MNQEWHDFLLAQGASKDFEDFGNPAAEFAAARNSETTLLVPLTDSALIRATGEDAVAFLHNLLTNDVSGLAADAVRYAGFCTPKGRLVATFAIWHEGPDLWLQLAADIQPAIQKKLSMYILRSKAKLETGNRLLLGLAGNNATAALTALGAAAPAPMQTASFAGGQVIGVESQRFVIALNPDIAADAWQKLTATAKPAGLNAWRALDIAAGLPHVVAATQEMFIPQMINYEAVGGVSFKKGCYPGQEIVARTQYLGKIKRRMYRAAVPAAAAPGMDLYAPETGEQSCGNVVTASATDGGSECLVVLQASTHETGEVHLGSPSGPLLKFLPLPYAN